MPQYIITPWRDLSELRLVRSQFYACLARSSPPTADERRQGVDTIRAWKFRGEVPHAVESTALLIDAAMTDDDALRCRAAISPWSVRAAYATAFARFVTGFVDASQTGRYKRSMYHVAQEIGLPTSFVELRHQIAHEEMPSVVVLRRAATRALEWLWEHFWRDIRDDDDPDGAMASGAGPDVEMDAVNERIRSEFRELLRQYVKQRIRDVAGKSKSKTKSSTTSHAETNLLDSDTGPLTAETSDNCLRKCHDNKHAMNLLGSVLLEIKFLVPANRAPNASLAPAFQLWDPLLQRLVLVHHPFLTILQNELLDRLAAAAVTPTTTITHLATKAYETDVSLDPHCQALHLWLRHILTHPGWAAVRRTAKLDYDAVMAACLVRQSLWSVRLARELSGLENDGGEGWWQNWGIGLEQKWGDLVERARQELDEVGGGHNGGREDVACTSTKVSVGEVSDGKAEGDSPETGDADEVVNYDKDGPGWQRWRGPWVRKPIGVV